MVALSRHALQMEPEDAPERNTPVLCALATYAHTRTRPPPQLRLPHIHSDHTVKRLPLSQTQILPMPWA